ncbi:hypothetical protein V8E36_008151 [Tilletia maclaganii]
MRISASSLQIAALALASVPTPPAVYDDRGSSAEYQALYTGTIGSVGFGQGQGHDGWLGPKWQCSHQARLPPMLLSPRAFEPNTQASTTNAFMRVLTWTFPVASGFASSGRPAHSTGAPASSEPSPPIRRHIRHGPTASSLSMNVTERNRSAGTLPIGCLRRRPPPVLLPPHCRWVQSLPTAVTLAWKCFLQPLGKVANQTERLDRFYQNQTVHHSSRPRCANRTTIGNHNPAWTIWPSFAAHTPRGRLVLTISSDTASPFNASPARAAMPPHSMLRRALVPDGEDKKDEDELDERRIDIRLAFPVVRRRRARAESR